MRKSNVLMMAASLLLCLQSTASGQKSELSDFASIDYADKDLFVEAAASTQKVYRLDPLALYHSRLWTDKEVAQDGLRRLANLLHLLIADFEGTASCSALWDYAAEQHIPRQTVDEIVRQWILNSANHLEYPERTGGLQLRPAVLTQLIFYFCSGDTEPTNTVFLESLSSYTNHLVCSFAAQAIVCREGRKAVPFLRKMLDAPRFSLNDYYLAYQEFGRQVARDKGMGTNVDEAVAFLLERTEKEKKGDAAKILDRVLCDILPEYKTSEQRHNLAVRMMNDVQTHMVYRNHFGQVRGQVEAVPEGKRADFAPFMEKMKAKESGASTNAAGGKKE